MSKQFGTGPLVLAIVAVGAVGLLWFARGGEDEAVSATSETASAPRVPAAGMPLAAGRGDRFAARRNPERGPAADRAEPAALDRRMVNRPGPARSVPGRDMGERPRGGDRAAGDREEARAEERQRPAPSETFDTVRAKALSDPDPEERIRALESLDSFDGQSALPILTQALSDQDPEVRLAALEELTFVTDSPPLDALTIALGDSDPEVRATALRIVADSDDDRKWPLIQSALKDPDEDVRGEAEDIVEMEGDEDDSR